MSESGGMSILHVGDKVQWHRTGLYGNKITDKGIVVDVGDIYCVCKFLPKSGVPALGIFLRNGSQAQSGNCTGYLKLKG